MRRAAALLPLILCACPDTAMSDAAKLEAAGRTKEAAELYVRIAKHDPANLAAWDKAVELWCNKLVHVGECMSVLDLELDLLGKITRHANALSEVLELRARARLEQGLVEPALNDLDRAERANPRRASVHVARAKALVMLGRRGEAEAAIRAARKLDPNDEEANAMIAELPATDTSTESFGGGAKP